MPISKDKLKVQVTMNVEMVHLIDKYAKAIGVSRSQYCAFALGQFVMNQERGYEIAEKLGADIVAKLEQNGGM